MLRLKVYKSIEAFLNFPINQEKVYIWRLQLTLDMANPLCSQKLAENENLVHHQRALMLIFCVLNLVFSLVATLGNLFVIRALCKASSIPATLKKLFLSLAVSDFAVGLFAQLMFGIIVAVMLKMAANGNFNFDFLCPRILTVCYFAIYLLTCASFLTIVLIAVDRVLVVFLHLRYQELVTSKRVVISLGSVWITSVVAVSSSFISLPEQNNMVVVAFEFFGLLVTTVGYIRIYKIVRYHRNQIVSQSQLQTNHTMRILRERKSTMNALLVYIVFLACFLPNLCCIFLLREDSLRLSFLVANHVSGLLVLLNSSLNPIIYCWRYREIREIVKDLIKHLFVTKSPTTINVGF